MLHLTKKIYLRYVDHFDYGRDSFVIQNGDWHDAHFDDKYGEIVSRTKSKVWGVCKTSKEFFSMTGDFASFVKKFAGSKGDGRLSIFCDPQAFQEITIRWYKSILPHATKEDLYDLFMEEKNNKLFSTVIVKQTTNYDATNFIKQAEQDGGALHLKYYDITKEDFFKVYDDAEVIAGLTPEMASIELQLASYFYKPEGPWTAELFKKIKQLYAEVFHYEIISLKTEIEERLYSLHELYPEKFKKPAFEMSVEEIITASGFTFIGDYRFNSQAWSTDYIEKTYGMQSLCERLLEFYVRSLNIKFPTEKFEFDEMQYTDARYLYKYFKSGKLMTPEEVIEDEADPHTEDLVFKYVTRTNKANEHLLLKVLRLAKLGRKDELKKYYLGE